VNQNTIKSNRKHGRRAPVLTVKSYKTDKHKTHSVNTYMHLAAIVDKDGVEVARVVYNPDGCLPCGAVAWIETSLDVVEAAVDGD